MHTRSSVDVDNNFPTSRKGTVVALTVFLKDLM